MVNITLLAWKYPQKYKIGSMYFTDDKVVKDLPYRRNGGKFKVSDYEYFDVGNNKHPFNFDLARS